MPQVNTLSLNSNLHLFTDADGIIFGAKVQPPKQGWSEKGGTADNIFEHIANRVRGGAADKSSGSSGHGRTAQRHPHQSRCISYGLSNGQGQRVRVIHQ